MNRFMLVSLALSATLGVSVGTGHAGSPLRDGLAERFRISRMEVRNPATEGHVIKKGTVLELQADGIPANPLRTVQQNTKSPRFHVPDYARVEVGRDGLSGDGGVVSLPKGTRVVVLDMKVSGDRVRLFTHTLDPVPLPGGKLGYGCTEFIFAFDPGTLDRADIDTVAGRIDHVLTRTSNG